VAPVIVAVVPGRVVAQPMRRIASLAELAALARVPLLRSLAPEAPLALALPELTQAETQVWEVRLNREWTACGCRAGEIAAMLAIAAYVSTAVLGWAPAVASTWSHVGWATLAALAAAAAGKVVGRGRSLARFRRLIREIEAALAARSMEPVAEEPGVAVRGGRCS
jgi:hypothetical protein